VKSRSDKPPKKKLKGATLRPLVEFSIDYFNYYLFCGCIGPQGLGSLGGGGGGGGGSSKTRQDREGGSKSAFKSKKRYVLLFVHPQREPASILT
jgi:hypothetical protein